MTENDAPMPPKKDMTPWEALGIVWEIGAAIAIPTVLSALIGRWLDRRFGTTPLFLILMLLISLGICAVIVVKRGKEIAKKL